MARMPWLASGALAWLAASAVACGGDDGTPPPPPACTPGAQQACTCEGGTAGTETCAADGSGFGACGACAARRLSFFEAPRYPINAESPAALVAADLDDDDRPELIVGTYEEAGSEGTVAVMPNVHGTFPTGAGYRTAPMTTLAVADLDGDRRPDLVIVHPGDAVVRLALAAGGFGPETVVATGTLLDGVAIGDLDGDGHADLAIARAGNDDVAIAHGRGDGSFAAPATIGTSCAAGPVAIADVDGDGEGDLVVGCQDTDEVRVLPQGGVPGGRAYPVGGTPHALAVADLGGDGGGAPDLLVAASGGTAMLRNDGLGGFAAAATIAAGGVDVAAGDLDGDGDLDAVVTDGVAVRALVDDGGTLTPGDAVLAGSFPQNLAIADLDHDGHADVAVTALRDKAVTVLLGRGDGTFAGAPLLAGPPAARAVALGDLDGNGRPDLVTVPADSEDVEVRFTGAGGALGPPVPLVVERRQQPAVTIADVDGDGRLDILTTSGRGLAYFLGRPGGTFSGELGVLVGGAPATSLAVTDLDGDRHPDVVLAPGANDSVDVLYARPVGSFELPVSLTVHAQPVAVAAGDLDGDGLPDLAVARAEEGAAVVVLHNLGGRQFAAPVELPIAGTRVALADVDGDGLLDAIVTDSVQGSQLVAFLRGTGGGQLAAPVMAPAPYASGAIALADLDGDHRLDVALGTGGTLQVFAGSATGLAAPASFEAGDRCYDAATGDLDGDGKIDVVVAGFPGVSVLRNTSR
ncbi:MAG TPA: VCBS repeat-containing protein [Kofleriaceae bacterium]|nr:VCBS repeat-containing protein [Kofleriaceae bacterium]